MADKSYNETLGELKAIFDRYHAERGDPVDKASELTVAPIRPPQGPTPQPPHKSFNLYEKDQKAFLEWGSSHIATSKGTVEERNKENFELLLQVGVSLFSLCLICIAFRFLRPSLRRAREVAVSSLVVGMKAKRAVSALVAEAKSKIDE